MVLVRQLVLLALLVLFPCQGWGCHEVLLEELQVYLRNHGSKTIAYSTIQPGMKYFVHPKGYVAYDTKWGFQYVLGDPIADDADKEEVIDAFLKKFPKACFCQVTRVTAEILARKKFTLNELGPDLVIHLSDYDFSGKEKSKLRQASKKLDREKYSIRELSIAEVGEAEIQRVSAEWREGKRIASNEVRFLTRPFEMPTDPDIRKLFVFSPEDKLVAFYFFDPIYRDGKVIGYSYSFKRHGNGSPTGAGEAVFVHAVELFKSEQKEVVTLGLIPFYQLEDNELPTDRIMHYAFRAMFHYDWFYNLQGQADYKHRFRGTPEKLYFATPSFPNVRRLLGLGRLCNLF